MQQFLAALRNSNNHGNDTVTFTVAARDIPAYFLTLLCEIRHTILLYTFAPIRNKIRTETWQE